MPRMPDECVNLVTGETILPSAVKVFRDIFPTSGEGWRKLRLTFKCTLGTATTPVTLGSFQFINNISLRTSKAENPVDIPAMGLYYLNWLMNGVIPKYTAPFAGAFYANIDIPFVFPFIARKDDLAIDSGRYNMIELMIQTGAATAMAATPGTVAATMDVTLIRNKTAYKELGKPVSSVFIKHLAPFDPVGKGYADVESARDLMLFGFFAVANSSPVVGTAYSGTPADSLPTISFRDNLVPWLDRVPREVFFEERSLLGNDGAALTALTGVYPWLFAKEGSYKQNLPTGNRTELKFICDGTPSASQVDLVLIGHRTLR